MANSKFVLVVTTQESAQAVKDKFLLAAQSPVRALNNIARYLEQMVGGFTSSSTVVLTTAVAATGTVTFSSIANNDTVTINGRVYTAKTSGASGLQQFNIGGSDTAAATNLAAAINADTSTLVKGVLTASAATTVVTVTAVTPGVAGNGLTLAISAHGSVSGSGLLTGGTSDAPVTIGHGI